MYLQGFFNRMFHCRKIKHRRNSIHNKTLKLVSQDYYDLRFKNFWLKASQLVLTKRSFSSPATELFKSKTEVPELMNNIFHFMERPYNFRSNYTLERRQDHMFITAQTFPYSQIVEFSTELN